MLNYNTNTLSGRFTPPTTARWRPSAFAFANSISFLESSDLRSKNDVALTPFALALLEDMRSVAESRSHTDVHARKLEEKRQIYVF